ncbi:MAG: acyl-CoA dehydrogenase family protein [candidate division Zixibacteria bacterium]|nr:acyl-CoA dehydrogenase family protein [candidate division Zixibacteria bacterium]
MIDYTLTENHRMVRDMAREVATKVIAPTITEFDRAQKMNPELHWLWPRLTCLDSVFPSNMAG